MVIEKELIINRNIDKAWQILGHEFADAHKWASVVNHSEAKGGSLNGSSCSVRGCDVSGMGKITEKLLHYSNETHSLTYQVTDGMPSMVKYVTNSWKLEPINNAQSKLTMKIAMQVGGFMGLLMKPMMKMQMTKMANNTSDDFKYYVENGKPSESKLKAMKKYRG